MVSVESEGVWEKTTTKKHKFHLVVGCAEKQSRHRILKERTDKKATKMNTENI